MPPDDPNPTPIVEAPNKVTPDNQADLPGAEKTPPEGSQTYDQAYVDRLKEQVEGRKTQAEKAENTLEQERLDRRQEKLLAPAPTFQQPPMQIPQPQYGPETFLTIEEESAQEKAYEDLNSKEIRRLDSLSRNRAIASSQANLIQNLGVAAGRAQVLNSAIADINAAPEWENPTVRQQLLLDTIETQRDPTQAGRYAPGEWSVPGVGVINPNILIDKIKDHRIAKGGAVADTKKTIKPESADVLGGEGPASALPGASGAFDASALLTDSERSLVRKGMNMKNTPYSSIVEVQDGFKKLFSGLQPEEQARRKESGAPTATEKVRAGTVWRGKTPA